MFVRIFLLSALTMGVLAGPAVSSPDSAAMNWSEEHDRQPVLAQQLAWIKIPKSSPRPAPCRYGPPC